MKIWLMTSGHINVMNWKVRWKIMRNQVYKWSPGSSDRTVSRCQIPVHSWQMCLWQQSWLCSLKPSLFLGTLMRDCAVWTCSLSTVADQDRCRDSTKARSTTGEQVTLFFSVTPSYIRRVKNGKKKRPIQSISKWCWTTTCCQTSTIVPWHWFYETVELYMY